jgi:hypothetical protein
MRPEHDAGFEVVMHQEDFVDPTCPLCKVISVLVLSKGYDPVNLGNTGSPPEYHLEIGRGDESGELTVSVAVINFEDGFNLRYIGELQIVTGDSSKS